MIYYPLSVLVMVGIQDVLVISTSNDLPNFGRLLGDGSRCGIKLSYKVQPKPEGLAQAFVLGEEFIVGEPCTLILGDNIFYGNGLRCVLKNAVDLTRRVNPLFSDIMLMILNAMASSSLMRTRKLSASRRNLDALRAIML